MEETVIKKGQTMTTKTLYIDSRTKINGNHEDFSISLPEQMTLWGSRVRIENIRMTDTFATVSDRSRYVYFLNGSGSLSAFALSPGAYTGVTFASELEFKSGRKNGVCGGNSHCLEG